MLNVLNVAGRVGKATASIVEVKTSNGPVEKLVVNFSVATKTFVKGKELTTWVWMSVWDKRAEAFIEFRPSFVVAYGELYAEQYVDKDGSNGTQLKLHRPTVQWGPKDGNNCTIDDRRTVAASAPAATRLTPAQLAQAAQILQMQAQAPATPAAEAPVEVGFDDGDPFAEDPFPG